MKLMWFNGFPKMYAQLEEGWGVHLPLVYVHCAIYETFWCNGFPEIYAQLEDGVESISNGYMCIVLYIYMKLIWCNGFQKIYMQLEEGVGVNLA